MAGAASLLAEGHSHYRLESFAKVLSALVAPHDMISVTVQQRTTGGWQLFSQGKANTFNLQSRVKMAMCQILFNVH